MGRRVFADVLHAHGLGILVHDEVFAQDTPDEVWIRDVAGRGLVAVTRDTRIGRSPTELHAVYASGLRMIAIVGGGVPAATLARNFVNAYPAILRFVERHPGPFIARLSRPGEESVLAAGGHGPLRMYKSRDDLLAQFGGS